MFLNISNFAEMFKLKSINTTPFSQLFGSIYIYYVGTPPRITYSTKYYSA